jgi:site-specific DNA-cytosine methylase
MLTYIDFCAGAGGMRAGLEAAGWHCSLAVDNNPDAVAVHRRSFGDAVEADLTQMAADEIPQADVWVAGFPCQPFSSSGNRRGFHHSSGNVFEHIARLMETRRPPLTVFENVEGLLTNKAGHTLASILSSLSELGYRTDWLLVNLRWFGIPQTRPRLFMVAFQPGVLRIPQSELPHPTLPGFDCDEPGLFSSMLSDLGASWQLRYQASLAETREALRPAIGKPRPGKPYRFGPLGRTSGVRFLSFDLDDLPSPDPRPSLAEIVAPHFRKGSLVRSVRYWSTERGQGPTRLHFRSEASSHCVGTSIGGAPLFAAPIDSVQKVEDREAFLEFSNWSREQDGVLVMRLRPERALRLFGPHVDALVAGLGDWDAGDTRKYQLVGNIVAPICAQRVAELVSASLAQDVCAKSSPTKGFGAAD